MINTVQKNEVFLRDFFSKCDQIRRFLRIWSYLLKKSLMKNFIFCPVRMNRGHSFSTYTKFSVSVRIGG